MKIPAVKMPRRYKKVDSLPNDPPYSAAYAYRTPGAECFALAYPVPETQAMPFDDPRQVIHGIHDALGEDQGLIEVENGVTAAGRPFIYSIVKTLQKQGGVQYYLRMNIRHSHCVLQVQAFFDEMGTTGVRDSMVYLLLSRQGSVRTTENGLEGWSEDPYDPNYTRGVCMNRAERKEYDSQFPNHPLSEMRTFAAELITLN